ncbi:MAG: helix-turn-helix domain-containing protein [Oscillospiraceae bacterium]|nr:helix-turn-helix domain-containing protein [Oscillospiraceae bacterium]
MWMLKRQLPFPHCACNIQDGAAEIRGVRLFSESTERFDPDYVYVAWAGPLGMRYNEDDVILMQKSNSIVIPGQTVEDVLNAALAVFDFYNEWEAELLRAANQPEAVQRIADIAAQALNGPVCVAGADGSAVACTSSPGPHWDDPGWQYFREMGVVPPYYTSGTVMGMDGTFYHSMTPQPRLYHIDDRICICARIRSGGENVGSIYVQEFDRRLDEADVQLCRVLLEVLGSLNYENAQAAALQSCSDTLRALILGAAPDPYSTARLDAQLRQRRPYRLLLLRSNTDNRDSVHERSVLASLRKLLPDSVSLAHEHSIVCVLPAEEAPERIGAVLELCHYRMGLSLPFDDWGALLSRYRQAVYAADTEVLHFRHAAFPCMTEALGKLNTEMDLLHPALAALKKADGKDGTAYYETLRTYLRLQCNMSAAAEALSLHRNSMKYRMQRIRELTAVDLEDAEEREYLLASYRVAEIKSI